MCWLLPDPVAVCSKLKYIKKVLSLLLPVMLLSSCEKWE